MIPFAIVQGHIHILTGTTCSAEVKADGIGGVTAPDDTGIGTTGPVFITQENRVCTIAPDFYPHLYGKVRL
ncbi:hypothetical protein D3C86_1175110 [compost metagenome]